MYFIMIKDKLVVILFYVYSAYGFSNKYCEICANHTLCLFPEAGPSNSCVKYDKNNTLKQEDIKSIVDRINSRRNFIALGRSKTLSGAANMKKIVWSDELAIFAQRWVDQCDPLTRPDKEDHCRNLDSIEVGQNIATMSDLSTNFNIASFVEVWFMQSLDYSGNVTYYNESDHRTRYFTQLIWANTDSVGCGQVENVRRVLRLVCNFAPKGNIHGKPVYLIGYPATQCLEDMVPDDNFKGLCTHNIERKAMKLTTRIPAVSSLLRIINLSNNIDLLHKNKTTSKVKSRKLTTILMNNTHAAVKRYPQHNFWEKANHSKLRDHNTHQIENPWHIYHGRESLSNFNTMNKKTETESQKYESIFTLPPVRQDPRKFKLESSCTRKTNPLRTNCDNNNDRTAADCTRGQKNECWTETTQNLHATSSFFYSICPCNSYTTTTHRTAAWMSCPCLKNDPQMICSNSRRIQDDFANVDSKNSGTFYHYDLVPNLHLREGIDKENVQNKLSTHVPWKESIDLVNLYKRKGYIPYYRQARLKRSDNRYTTIMPFWQMDDTLYKKTPQFKATVRYTTLPNKKMKHTTLKSATTSIEPITLRLAPSSLNRELASITEKYLSFDELMQLRNKGGDARRQGATTKATTTPTTTKEITANTPFVRMKHCTRKLTCTWTVAQMTDCNGSIIYDNDGSNRGSRTPPGYVDGCTRTSTCTRDYMDRNKLVPSTEDSENIVTTTEIDDDYCERRSLDIRRRNSQEQITSNNRNIANLHSLRTSFKKKTFTNILSDKDKTEDKQNNGCLCYNFAERVKRDDTGNKKFPLKYDSDIKKSQRNHNEYLYYGELYYKVLRKIRETWDKNKKRNLLGKCFCNGTVMHDNHTFVLITILSCFIMFTRKILNYLFFI